MGILTTVSMLLFGVAAGLWFGYIYGFAQGKQTGESAGRKAGVKDHRRKRLIESSFANGHYDVKQHAAAIRELEKALTPDTPARNPSPLAAWVVLLTVLFSLWVLLQDELTRL